MAGRVVQRVVMPRMPGVERLYARFDARAGVALRGRRAAILPRGTLLRTDTYFNGFYEGYWRQYTRLGRLVLRTRVRGAGTLRLFRRTTAGGDTLLDEVEFAGNTGELRLEVPPGEGMLFFELVARSHRAILRAADWVAVGVTPRSVRLVAGYCTFDREAEILRNVAILLEERALAGALAGVVVVDQGGRPVCGHPDYPAVAAAAGRRLRVVRQDNFGGAGGFTRSILEALDTPSATHVLLMDDDAIIEPESVRRAAAFLSLARGDLAVGGQMLDQRRPRELVEPGSRYRPEQVAVDPPVRRRVDRRGALTPLLEAGQRDFNGWWFFAFPLGLVRRVGLPLPLFLRGDDAEFGCRLLRAGVPTVPLPGVAVWHEPFETKGRSWHPYYETRNLLAVGALHYAAPGAGVLARRFLARLLEELLAYDYYEAWLLCEAMAAYLHGPEVLREDPQVLHRRLAAVRAEMAPASRPRGLPVIDPPAPSGNRLVRRLDWLAHFVRNLFRTALSAEEPRHAIRAADERWYGVAGCDVVAVEDPYRDDLVVLRRSRGRFVRLLLRGLGLAVRLVVSHRRAAWRWRCGLRALTGEGFWREYLGLAGPGRLQVSSRRGVGAAGPEQAAAQR